MVILEYMSNGSLESYLKVIHYRVPKKKRNMINIYFWDNLHVYLNSVEASVFTVMLCATVGAKRTADKNRYQNYTNAQPRPRVFYLSFILPFDSVDWSNRSRFLKKIFKTTPNLP